MNIKTNIKKYLSFTILILSSCLLVACAELDEPQPVSFMVVGSQQSTDQDMCREGIQATFTMLSDQTEYASAVLSLGEEYRAETDGTYTSRDRVRIAVQCFEANDVKGSIIVEGSIAPNHNIVLPVNAPPRNNVSFGVFRDKRCTQDLINETISYDLEIVELVEPVPCLNGRFNPRPE